MAIHVAITRRVRPGCEADFQDALREFFQRSFDHGSAMGASMLTPMPGDDSREFGIIRTFADEAQRDAFYASPLFAEWESRARTLTEGEPEYRDLHGLEAFFRSSPQGTPPRWKMALLTWLAVWPVSMVVPAMLLPLLGGALSRVLTAGVISAGIVVVLTWIAMPLLVRAARPWLRPDAHPSNKIS